MKQTAVRVGDTVIRRPLFTAKKDITKARPMSGTVVYVHPKGRYHTVEFRKGSQPIKESFAGVAFEDRGED